MYPHDNFLAFVRGSCQGNLEWFLYKAPLQSSFDFEPKTPVRCGVAIQYSQPCEERRSPGTFATTRDVGCQVLTKKSDGIPLVFVCVWSFCWDFWGTTNCHIRFQFNNIPESTNRWVPRKMGGLGRCSSLSLRVYFQVTVLGLWGGLLLYLAQKRS